MMIKAVRSFFIAIDIDDEEIVNRIRSFQRELIDKGFAEIQPNERLHITLNFLGKLQWKTINEMRVKLRKIRMNSFETMLRGVKHFPSAKLPIRILWVGVESVEVHGLMEKVHAVTLDRHAEEIPHVTIARVRKIVDVEGLKRFIRNYEDYFFGKFHVNCFKLKANVGGKYMDIERYSLL